jgi:hypothetical protein
VAARKKLLLLCAEIAEEFEEEIAKLQSSRR